MVFGKAWAPRAAALLLLLCTPGAQGLRREAAAAFEHKAGCEDCDDMPDALEGAKFDDLGEGDATNFFEELGEVWTQLVEAWQYDKRAGEFVKTDEYKEFECCGIKKKEQLKDGANYIANPSRPLELHDFVAMWAYTGPLYSKMNKALRAGVDKEKMEPLNAVAVGALSKLRSYTGLMLYRGSRNLIPILMEKDDKGVEGYKRPGFQWQDKGFMSTTENLQVAAGGKFDGGSDPTKREINWILFVDCKTGGCLGKEISMFSKYPGEKEILFPPSFPFLVESFVAGDKLPTNITVVPAVR